MSKIEPIKKINIDNIGIGDIVQVHATRLASFKAIVSRQNKGRDTLARFDYGTFKNEYYSVKRIDNVTRTS